MGKPIREQRANAASAAQLLRFYAEAVDKLNGEVYGSDKTTFINAAAPASEGAGDAAFFEPSGHSGIGVEGGLAGLESYLRRQAVWINHG